MKHTLSMLMISLIYTNAYAMVSKQDINEVLHTLQSHMSVVERNKPIHIYYDVHDESCQMMAYHDVRVIRITSSMMLFLNTKDELAIFLAHELGHIELDQHKSSYDRELASDLYSIQLTNKSGYNSCVGPQLWRRAYELTGMIDSTNHPTLKQRIKMFTCK